MSIAQNPLLRRRRKAVAGAVAALALGGLAAGCGSSATTATTGAGNAAATTPSASASAHGMPPGLGTPVTGASADRAKAAALAKYPGAAERVMRLSDGSYVVHVITGSGGEVHVQVSKAFAVTGTETGPPGAAPPAGGGTTTQS